MPNYGAMTDAYYGRRANRINEGTARRGAEMEGMVKKLAGAAAMGDPGALEQLMQIDPKMGMQIRQSNNTRTQAGLSQQADQQKARQQQGATIQGLLESVAQFDNADTAKQALMNNEEFKVLPSQIQQSIIQGMTPESFALLKQGAAGAPTASEQNDKRMLDVYNDPNADPALKAKAKTHLYGASKGSESQRQIKIKQYMTEYDLDAATATALVDGQIEFQKDPVTEAPYLATKVPGYSVGAEGLVANEPTPVLPATPDATGERPDITGGIDVLEEFGGPADVAARWGEYVPFLNDVFTGEDEIQAKVVMDSIGIDIERAFAKNPRFAEGEVKRLQKLVPTGGVLSTKSASSSQLRGLQKSLAVHLYDETEAAANGKLAPKARGEAEANVVNIRNLITKLDQILAAASEFTPEQIATEIQRRKAKAK